MKEVEATFFQNCYSIPKYFKATLWKSNSLRFLSKVTSLRDSSIFAMNFCTIKEIRLAGLLSRLTQHGAKRGQLQRGRGQVGSNLGLVGYFVMGELSNKIDSSLVST